MARIQKTDYHSPHYKHREHRAKRGRRTGHGQKRALEILLKEKKEDEERKESKYKKLNF